MNLFYHKNKDVKIKGLEYVSAYEAEANAYYDKILDCINEYALDVEVICVYVYGSRLYGNPRRNSDLDFVVFYAGHEREDYFFNTLADEKFYIENLVCDFNPIKLVGDNYDALIEQYIKSHDIEYNGLSEKNVIKVDKNHILLEDAWAGQSYGMMGYNNAGFSYSIMPLLFNLSQKGNDNSGENNNKSYKHFPGDCVEGHCKYDNKKHKGIVKYLYFDDSNSDLPKLVYILDMDNNDTIPLDPDTVKTCSSNMPDQIKHMDYIANHPYLIDYDFQNISPVAESFDFNKAIKK